MHRVQHLALHANAFTKVHMLYRSGWVARCTAMSAMKRRTMLSRLEYVTPALTRTRRGDSFAFRVFALESATLYSPLSVSVRLSLSFSLSLSLSLPFSLSLSPQPASAARSSHHQQAINLADTRGVTRSKWPRWLLIRFTLFSEVLPVPRIGRGGGEIDRRVDTANDVVGSCGPDNFQPFAPARTWAQL